MTTAAEGWERLLKSATVRLHGRYPGTGFVVAPGLVVTCAHVVAQTAKDLPGRLDGQVVALDLRFALEPVPETYVWDRENGLDLVVLRIVGDAADRLAPVLMSGVVAIGDPLWAYGHPADSLFGAGQSATSRYEGTDLRSDRPGAPELPRGWGTPVGPGFSGSGVINRRTGAVCGMLCTSDHGGSAHMIPVAEILGRCPAARDTANLRGDWLGTLDDDQIAAGAWSFPGPLLRRYLRLVAKAADAQPYPVLRGVDPDIPLSSVFVRRQASATARGTEPERAGQPDASVPDQVRLPAEVLFGLDEDVVLVGAPGSGKSSLLRAAVRELAGRWEREGRQREDWNRLVPVRVHALDLDTDETGPAALAAGLRVELSEQWDTAEPWSGSLFAGPPAAGARWLIMVDGLDEINDSVRRQKVMRRLGHLREEDPEHRVYLCLVATRPLPGRELPTAWGRRFELMPLEPGELTGFAEKWFRALGVDEWRQSAERFTAELRNAGMTDPARNPLMASMLCQLFFLNQKAALPRGRAAAYDAFVKSMHERAPARSGSGPEEQTRAFLRDRRYSPDVERVLEQLPGRLPASLRALALARHDGDRRSAVDLLTERSAGLFPPGTAPKDRDEPVRRLMPELLRTSGLLVEDGTGFTFVHQTFGEFLTAQAIVGDPRRSSAEFQRVFGLPAMVAALGGAWLGVRTPGTDSLTRFLVEAWNAHAQWRPRLSRVLGRIAPTAEGARFVAAVVADGAELDAGVLKSATDTLHLKAQGGDLASAAALARMGDRRGDRILWEKASSDSWAPQEQIAAAQVLADLGDPRGINALHTMATTHPALAMEAAEELARRGDQRGADLLRGAIRDPDTDTDLLLKAAAAAARLDAAAIPEELVARAFEPRCPARSRIAVAQYLDRHADARGADALAGMVRNPPSDCDALLPLQALGGMLSHTTKPSGHARTALRTLAADRTLPVTLRLTAAQCLHQRWGEEEPLFSVAEDPRMPPDERLAVLNRLPKHDPRSATLAGALVRDRRATPAQRVEAAQWLAGHTANEKTVVALLAEDDLLPELRMALLTGASEYSVDGSEWWRKAMAAAVRDGSLSVGQRRDLVDRLARVEARDHRWPGHLLSLAAAHGLPGSLRLRAAVRAHRHSGDGTYGALVLDPSLEPRFRAEALARALLDGLALLTVATAAAVRRLVSGLVALICALAIAALPLCAAVAAVALDEAHRSASPPAVWKQGLFAAVTVLSLVTVFSRVARHGRSARQRITAPEVFGTAALSAGACFYGLSHQAALHGWLPAVGAGAAALLPAALSMTVWDGGRGAGPRPVRGLGGGFGRLGARGARAVPHGWSDHRNSARLLLSVLAAVLAWLAVTDPASLGALTDLGTRLAARIPWTGRVTVTW
ncbi:trypsin-like peptidase domain-containing protein [Streptomyces sp. Caat 7-52]|uniref:trypsin-like peptidase domain-containing protein n=1 Tax=Streptomyces sp. Caat 7-52 TaxID=2949637 RepID=UPI0020356AA9|nr:trypsin-like peptidase domain-containing protein [Streptomyces sp. Caat 7-52]